MIPSASLPRLARLDKPQSHKRESTQYRTQRRPNPVNPVGTLKPSQYRGPKAPRWVQRATRIIHAAQLSHKQRESNDQRLVRPARQHEDGQYKLRREKCFEEEPPRDANGWLEFCRCRQRAGEQRGDDGRGADAGDELRDYGV